MAVGGDVSLQDVLGDVPPDKLDQPCRERHLCHIARELTNWPFLAPFLGIKESEVEVIRGKWPYDVPSQKLEVLKRWKAKRHRKYKDTYRHLCKAFVDAQQMSLATKVCDILSLPLESASEGSSDENDGRETGSKSRVLDPLARHLRRVYRSATPDFIALQWPPPHTRKVFNLSMIYSSEIVRRRPLLEEDVVCLSLYGSVTDIVRMGRQVTVEELFTQSAAAATERQVILVEGTPGAGKSTLAWHISQKWEAQEMFHKEFDVVLYIQLRDTDVQSANDLADMIPMELESERKDAISLIRSCHDEKVLFILDGWDEFRLGLQRDSIFEKLICHPWKLGVECSTVLITSRPIASGPLQRYATSRVEIVGFTEKEICSYFEEVFKDPKVTGNLFDHLQKHPTIKAICYLPLNAAIVAHLFIELNHTLPTTLTDLFLCLVLSCIIRHVTKEYDAQPKFKSLDDLPLDLQEAFDKVCTVAYKGTMMNKVVFTGEDLQSCGLSEQLNVLSLMQVVPSFATGKPSSYHFLHLSIQEILTALVISKLPPTEQVAIFNDMLTQPRFEATFTFYTAITKLQTEGVTDIIREVVHPSQSSRHHSEYTRIKSLLNLMHSLYEVQSVSLCHFVGSLLEGRLNLSCVPLNPYDVLSLQYFLSCVNGESLSTSHQVRELVVCQCALKPENLHSLPLKNIEYIDLCNNKLTLDSIAEALTRSPELKRLSIGVIIGAGESFAAALKQHTSLKHLAILGNFRGSAASSILKAIEQHQNLTHLNLRHSAVDTNEVSVLLKANTSLQELELCFHEDRCLNSQLDSLAAGLQKNKSLKKLEFDVGLLNRPLFTIHEVAITEFMNTLQHCHLRTLVIRELEVSDEWIQEVNSKRTQCGLQELKVEVTKTIGRHHMSPYMCRVWTVSFPN